MEVPEQGGNNNQGGNNQGGQGGQGGQGNNEDDDDNLFNWTSFMNCITLFNQLIILDFSSWSQDLCIFSHLSTFINVYITKTWANLFPLWSSNIEQWKPHRESTFSKAISSFPLESIYPGLSHTIFYPLLSTGPPPYFPHPQHICSQNSKSSPSHQNLSSGSPKPLIHCKLFMPVDWSPNALILLSAPSVCIANFTEDSALIVESLALNFQYFPKPLSNSMHKNLPNLPPLHRILLLYSKAFISVKVNFQSQIFPGKSRCNLPRSFLIHWRLHGKLEIRLDILVKEKDEWLSFLS